MLIRNAEIVDLPSGRVRSADLRLAHGRIRQIGSLVPQPGEILIDAGGGALLPGLHDHHIHLMSFAASLDSVRCGPPEVASADALSSVLCSAATRTGWLRGIGYHESVAGDIDSRWLDARIADHPVRIQHRSGRLWILNSAALAALRDTDSAPVLPGDGRIYDQDLLLGELFGRTLPPMTPASRRLASYGVTAVTDMTPSNDEQAFTRFTDLHSSGHLLQSVHLAGSMDLPYPSNRHGVVTGATKIHLHDSSLPVFEDLCELIRASHANDRPVAVHCVTEVALVFALAALRETGLHQRDRIEHASVTPPSLVDQLYESGLLVVTQTNFVAERGDEYLEDLPKQEHPWLYRAGTFLARGVRLAGGTDAPFGEADPWIAMHAAVTRTTRTGAVLGAAERLTPEQAMALFAGSCEVPEIPLRLEEGAVADLCLLSEPWGRARRLLSSDLVSATLRRGELIFDRTGASLRDP